MNIWIIIGIGIVALASIFYAIYKQKINKAREQQRLTLTQNISSPKALSTYEVWRQTKNMTDLIKQQLEGVK